MIVKNCGSALLVCIIGSKYYLLNLNFTKYESLPPPRLDQYSLGLDNDMKDAAKNAMNDAILDGSHWVLKPQREGGGNNMYGKAVSEYLSANRNCSVLSGYVLMRRIFPVVQKSAFLRGGNLQILPSVSEYGTYGVFLGDGNKTPIINAYAGYLVRTKPSGT